MGRRRRGAAGVRPRPHCRRSGVRRRGERGGLRLGTAGRRGRWCLGRCGGGRSHGQGLNGGGAAAARCRWCPRPLAPSAGVGRGSGLPVVLVLIILLCFCGFWCCSPTVLVSFLLWTRCGTLSAWVSSLPFRREHDGRGLYRNAGDGSSGRGESSWTMGENLNVSGSVYSCHAVGTGVSVRRNQTNSEMTHPQERVCCRVLRADTASSSGSRACASLILSRPLWPPPLLFLRKKHDGVSLDMHSVHCAKV